MKMLMMIQYSMIISMNFNSISNTHNGMLRRKILMITSDNANNDISNNDNNDKNSDNDNSNRIIIIIG